MASQSLTDELEQVVSARLDALKPRLRGWLHAGVTPVVLAAGIVLVCLAPTPATTWAAVVYSLAGLVLFATSAVYHVGTWSPGAHGVLKRVDHANIYLIIAGSYTPLAATVLTGGTREALLVVIWVGAAMGVVFRAVWIDAPRLLYTGLYLVLGWSFAPFIGDLFATSASAGILTVAGGLLYTAGGVVYGLRRPDPRPTWFGFHEVFHALTIGAWVCHYVAISVLIYQH
ncbi:hemolysin III family protein [Nocardioides sp. W7]|uniref:PAQR family membrane homeostasis protein TrhA n=1 Tax=Nocardioides sp. W7 TaxID=2931390 RepID=UPI001FD28453|nr:hemolysin III family protein [Nocardioides sp. W7]